MRTLFHFSALHNELDTVVTRKKCSPRWTLICRVPLVKLSPRVLILHSPGEEQQRVLSDEAS